MVQYDDYVFTLSNLLKDESCRFCLRLFLKQEHSAELIDFLTACSKLHRYLKRLDFYSYENDAGGGSAATTTTTTSSHYHSSGLQKKIKKQLQLISRQFLKDGSPSELTRLIPATRSNVCHLIDQWILVHLTPANTTPHTANNVNLYDQMRGLVGDIKSAFRPMIQSIETELTCHVLPRFLRSHTWMQFVQKTGHSMVKRVGRHKKAIEMSYTDSDFLEHVVDDRDMEFQLSLMEDSFDWKLVGWSNNNRRIMAFQSSKVLDYLPDVSWVQNASACKFSGVLNYPFEMCEYYMFHSKYMQRFDDNVVGQRTIAYYSHEQLKAMHPNKNISQCRSCAVVIYDVKFPFPLIGPRVYCVAISGYYNKAANEAYLFYKPCHHSSLDNINLNKVCFLRDIQLYVLKKIDEQKTLYYQIHIFNSGSTTGNKLSSLVISRRAKQLSSNIHNFLKSQEHLPIPEPDLDDGAMRSYLDHKNYVKSLEENMD